MANTISAVGAIGFVFAVCATGMLIPSMITVYWRSPSFGTGQIISAAVEVDSGLFQTCTVVGCADIGWDINAGVTILTTRAILFVACILIAIGLIIGVVALCGKTDLTSKGALDIVGGLFILVACGAYTGMSIGIDSYAGGQPQVKDFGWGFFLCWGSGAAFIFAGILEVNGKAKAQQQGQVYPSNMQQQMVWATNMQQVNANGAPPHVRQHPQRPSHQIVQLPH